MCILWKVCQDRKQRVSAPSAAISVAHCKLHLGKLDLRARAARMGLNLDLNSSLQLWLVLSYEISGFTPPPSGSILNGTLNGLTLP